MLSRRSGAAPWAPLAAVALSVGLVTLAPACSDDDDAAGPVSTTPSTALTATTRAAPVASSTTTKATTTTSNTTPAFAEADLESLAASLGVATLVVEDADESGVLTWAGGQTGRAAVPKDTFAWSDGSYLYWLTRERMEDGPDAVMSFAATFDGTPVCEAPGEIQSVAARDDGRYEAVIEFEPSPDEPARERPRERARFDCASGAEVPLDPVTWRREAGWRSLLKVADRTFEVVGDAEGNADITNEDGVPINGDDYAGSHDFSPDGSRVVYGDYGTGAGPHTTRVIRVSDTVTGEMLWSAEVDRTLSLLSHTGDRVLVGQPRPEHDAQPWESMESIVVFDATTGEKITDVPAWTRILYAGP